MSQGSSAFSMIAKQSWYAEKYKGRPARINYSDPNIRPRETYAERSDTSADAVGPAAFTFSITRGFPNTIASGGAAVFVPPSLSVAWTAQPAMAITPTIISCGFTRISSN